MNSQQQIADAHERRLRVSLRDSDARMTSPSRSADAIESPQYSDTDVENETENAEAPTNKRQRDEAEDTEATRQMRRREVLRAKNREAVLHHKREAVRILEEAKAIRRQKEIAEVRKVAATSGSSGSWRSTECRTTGQWREFYYHWAEADKAERRTRQKMRKMWAHTKAAAEKAAKAAAEEAAKVKAADEEAAKVKAHHTHTSET